ncbi:hypothetical protein EXU57_17460 [Segetibacter sp. 3557_3]|uniref:hypothetical protein n=1 Tax=Segetibacter sp. 3557_3 TaxID=2547429 RepID=UPI0010589565|nr:hypothetical protein [Segetibacter sp. 3557_3]TDH23262.1 hypothetical protein EXU57_17460 [Segetibacter sp. 3557_3]
MNAENLNAELLQIAPVLARVPKRNVYRVPDGYFGELQTSILNKLQEVTQLPEVPFSVPEGYFNTLPLQILRKIRENEAVDDQPDELADTPIIRGISKAPVYSVPDGYFKGLNAMETINPGRRKPAVVHSMKKLTRYMAAAVITGLLAIAGVTYLNDGQQHNSKESQSARVINFNPVDVQQLSESEIDEFLVTQTTPEASALNAAANGDTDIKGNLQEIPAEDIQEYLKENPLPGETNTDG